MADRIQLMMEAERRGILPPDKAALLNEARKRGLVEDVSTPPQPTPMVNEPEPEQTPEFMQRIGEDVSGRLENIKQARARTTAGTNSRIEEVIPMAWNVAAIPLDVAGEAAGGAFRALPDVIEDPIRAGAAKTVEAFARPLGDLPSSLAQGYGSFKQQNPSAAANLEGVAGLATILAPTRSLPVKQSGKTFVGKAGEAVTMAGENQLANRRLSYAQKLISPERTKSIAEDQVGRTTEQGLSRFRSAKVEPTSREIEIAQEVSRLPISSSRSNQHNYNIISSAVEREAEKLKSSLTANDVKFSGLDYANELSSAMNRIKQNPTMVGDAEKSAERILNKMADIVSKKPKTAANLLQARKELDSWVKSQSGGKLFDPQYESARSIALREIRNATNDFIDSRAKNVGVKQSLRKQNNLYMALENVQPKAASEGKNAVSRLYQKVSKVVPLKSDIGKALGLAGVAGAGSVVGGIPAAAALGTGAVLYGAGKAAISPTTKKALGKLLRGTDAAIRATKDKAVIEQLRADRAIVLELMKNTGQEDNDRTK